MAYDTRNNNLLIIFNIEESREGSQYDVINLMNSFSKLRFEINRWNNLTIEKFNKKMEELPKQIRDKGYQSIVIFVMAHGTLENLTMDNNQALSQNNFVTSFFQNTFRDFIHIPRLFFFQSCREYDCGANGTFVDIHCTVKNLIKVFPAGKGIL